MGTRWVVVLVAAVLLAGGFCAARTEGQERPGCVGDCDSSGTVTVDELVRGVDIALGVLPLEQCLQFDCHNEGQVTVDCLINAVNNAVSQCSGATPSVTPSITATLTQTATVAAATATQTAALTTPSAAPATVTKTSTPISTATVTVSSTATVTPTPTATATHTYTPTPGPCDPALLHVAPVTSPTDRLVQTIHVTSFVPGSLVSVSVRTNSVLEYVTYSDAELPQEVDFLFALLAGSTSNVAACFQSTACQGFVCTTTDVNGNALQIQQIVPTARPPQQTVTPPSSPTPTATAVPSANTPTRTPADCGAPRPVVGAVISPTTALTQVISGYAERLGPYDGVSVCSPAGCVTSSLAGSFMYYGAFAVEVPLAAGMQNPVEVCTFDNCGGRTCVHTAVNGEPLIIAQVATNS